MMKINQSIPKYFIIVVLIVAMFLEKPITVMATSEMEINELTASELVKQFTAGWTLGNSFDSHYGEWNGKYQPGNETLWGNPKVTEELIDYVSSLGFNSIRIPVTWYYNTYRDSSGALKIHEEWLERVAQVVNYALDNDMYVMIDSHHDDKIIYTGVNDTEFQKVKSDSTNLWRNIAEYFKNYDEHLIFEAYNEVDNRQASWQYGSLAASQMNELNQLFVSTVRATGGNNSTRYLCVPTLLHAIDINSVSAFKLPIDSVQNRLFVSVHCYNTLFDQNVEDSFQNIDLLRASTGVPVLITEYGTTSGYSPSNYRTVAASNMVAIAQKHQCGIYYWDNGSDYGIINRKNYTSSNVEMVKALLNPTEFVTSNSKVCNSMSDFVWSQISTASGMLKEDKYWGTIISGTNETGISIPDNSNYVEVSLVTGNENGASAEKMHYIVFYDANMNVIPDKSVNEGWGFATKIVQIPQNAKYVRIGINSSTHKTDVDLFTNYFNCGMKMTVTFV